MKIKSEKGFTGIDIATSLVILFILVSIVATLSYSLNSKSKELEYSAEATNIAINLIEQVKAKGFSTYEGLNGNTIIDINGNTTSANTAVTNKEGFYQTITVSDYADDNSEKTSDIVKIVTVKVSYMFKGEEQSVELSTILSKES